MKLACVGYRDWALQIYENVVQETNFDILMIQSKNEYDEQKLIDFNPDLILYYGWSWEVSATIINKFTSIMLHPSPLPKYRGGSPIQNQIISGEKSSMVTLFVMDKEMDAGLIIAHKEFSLEGHLKDIFQRIIAAGTELTLKILREAYTPYKQDESKATYYKRRKPEESELTMEELITKDGEYLFNKIRMLEDPYPNAFIKTIDGRKLIIKLAELK